MSTTAPIGRDHLADHHQKTSAATAAEYERVRRAVLKDFTAFLRAQFTPEQIGLQPPKGRGRRAPGVSQRQVSEALNDPVVGKFERLRRFERGDIKGPEEPLVGRYAELFRLRREERRFLNELVSGTRDEAERPPRSLDSLRATVANAAAPTRRRSPYGVVKGPYTWAMDELLRVVAAHPSVDELFFGQRPANFFEFVFAPADGEAGSNDAADDLFPQYGSNLLRRATLRLFMARLAHPNHPDLPGVIELFEKTKPRPDYITPVNPELEDWGDLFPYNGPDGLGTVHSVEMGTPGAPLDAGGTVSQATFYGGMSPTQVIAYLREQGSNGELRSVSRRSEFSMVAASPKPLIDTSVAHPARVYDWLLGGKDHYAVDAEVGKHLPPEARPAALANRAFMRRSVAHIARQGVEQFLDIGTGIPTEPNLHQVVQGINAASRIVYTDNDPIVLRHAEALLVSHPEGATRYVQCDVRSPEAVIEHARNHFDFDRPVALSLIGLLHFLPDDTHPYDIVRTLMEPLPSGSYLVLSQGASDLMQDVMAKATEAYKDGSIRTIFRTRDEFTRFFDGLDIVDPGVVTVTEWFRDEEAPPYERLALYGAVGMKP